MYGYEEYIPLDEAEILKRVNQEDIIEMALGFKPVPYQKMLNPFKRHDTKPGAWFEWHNGKFFFIDFGDNPTHRIPFKFIKDFYNVTFIEGLKIINTHFQLGLGENAIVQAKPIIFHNPYQQFNAEKQKTHITYKARPLGIRDKSSWYKYGITREHLMEDEVLAGIWYKMYSRQHQRWVVIRPQDNFYVFSEFTNGNIKILRPGATTDYKWTSNCDENDIFGHKKLPNKGAQCIIQKSYKDQRVLRNQGLTSIAFQNEGCIPKDEIIIDLVSRFNSLPVFYDNDETGIRAAIKVSEHINQFCPNIAYPIHLPESLKPLGISDPADLYQKKSQAALQTFLREKGLYGTNPSNNT